MTWRLPDKYCVVMLHMDGLDGSTTFIDESGKTWTPVGNVQIDTAQSKFNGVSGLFDGTNDYITTADSVDWRLDSGSNSNKWTVDFWVRFNGDPGTATQGFVSQWADVNNFWGIALAGNTLYFNVRSGAAQLIEIFPAWNPAGDTWYHVAVIKDGTNGYMMFINGTQIGVTTTDTDPMPDIASVLYVGGYFNAVGASFYLNGWLDEFRISKGIARWTANFTPPTKPYQPFGVIAHVISK